MNELYFGIDVNHGTYMHISEVPRGLDCNCKCPECGGELIAKKGDILRHHFAHSIQGSYECQGYGAEMTFVHKRAQEVLKEHATEIHLQRYGDSHYMSDFCGVLNGVKVHVEVVVSSRLKENKLAFIKKEFNEPYVVYRCDLSREQEREKFMGLLGSEHLYPFIREQFVRIPTYYDLLKERESYMTVKQWVESYGEKATVAELKQIGELASVRRQQRQEQQVKCPEVVNGVTRMVNAYSITTFQVAYSDFQLGLRPRELKRFKHWDM